jgi:hypothetical protein
MHRFVFALLIALLAFLALLPFSASGATNLSTVFTEIEQQYSIPQGILARVARAESNFVTCARSRHSSATGLFQWLDGSWLQASRALYGRARPLEERCTPSVAAKVTAFTLAQAQTQLRSVIERSGTDLTTGLYMSHFLGIAGARKFFESMAQDPRGNAAAAFPKAAAANKPIFYNGGQPRSFSEIIQLMAKKMGVDSAVPAVPVAGDFSNARGESFARNSDDIRTSQFVPTSQIPATETEWDYQTTYTPQGQNPGIPANPAPSSPLSPQQNPSSSYSAPLPPLSQLPNQLQPSALFPQPLPSLMMTTSPAYTVITSIAQSAPTTSHALALNAALQQTAVVQHQQATTGATTVQTRTRPLHTFGATTTREYSQLLARLRDLIRSIRQWLTVFGQS